MTHLEAADAGVPAHVVRSESAGAPGAGHEALLDVGPHADHGSGLQPGEPGLGTHGVCAGDQVTTGVWSQHPMCLMCGQCSVSPHCRRISEKLIMSPLCAALRLDVTRRLVYCAVQCTVPRAACTVLC